MSRFLLLTVLLSAVLSSYYLKLTYQDKIVRCIMTTVRRGCVLNLYINDKDNMVASSSTEMSVQYEWKSISISTFLCDAKCGHVSQSYTLGPVKFTVNRAVFIGLVLGGALFLPLTCLGLTVCRDRRQKRRDARNRVPDPPPPVSFATSRDTARYHSNTPAVDSLRGPRHEVRTSQHTGPASYRREELPRSPPTVPREELSLAPVHAPPTASRGVRNLEHALHIAPVEAPPLYEQALPSYEQALEMILATDIPESRC